MRAVWFLAALLVTCYVIYPAQNVAAAAEADETALNNDDVPVVDSGLKGDTTTATDAEAVRREREAIKLDGMSVAESEALRKRAEKHEFQAEVNRMMTLIINSLYKNKEIYLRELISNASDALDKIRFMSLTDPGVLGDKKDLTIKIHVDKENKVLHITDSGVGMTRDDLIKNLGTIAKSGTSEFLSKMQDGSGADTSNLIGQFGVGFYSAFLVADTVVVTSKNNDDKQHIWTSDASSFSVVEDPRPDEQLGRGTRVSLYLKEEAQDYLDTEVIKGLIKKYSEFINFDIYLYTSKTVEVEVEDDDDEGADDKESSGDDDAKVEDDESTDGEKKKKKTVTETQWDWEIINANKPIWTRSPKDVTDEEYNKFYKAFSKEDKDALAHTHFVAEGEVTFKAILYVPAEPPRGFFHEYGQHRNTIKMYVRRVFIMDEFEDLLPKYLSFLRGVVDSDDLPLNVSRETLQQHKLLKVIKKKLIRKALEMLKKLTPEQFDKFYKEYSTSLKLGLIEDHANRTRLAKLLRFASSAEAEKPVALDDYVARMKKDQSSIFFIAGQSRAELEKSPFVERLLKRGFEVLFLTEPVDEYTIQNLPEYEGHKFQNVAKEGLSFGDETDEEKAHIEALKTEFEPLTKWLGEKLSDEMEKAVISTRLTESPCALVASQYGWDGNMERIMKAQAYSQNDNSNSHFANQKKTLEINPYHPLVKKLLARVSDDDTADEESTMNMAQVLVDTARLRSGYSLADSARFANRIEMMLRLGMGVDLDAVVESEPVFERKPKEGSEKDEDDEDEEEEEGEEKEEENNAKDEL